MPLLLLLLAAAFVAKFAWILVAFAATGRLIGGWWRGHDERAAAERRRQAELRARADRQHAAVLAGDELAGVYGDYPPAPGADTAPGFSKLTNWALET
jgi:hypothetical protein